MRTGHTFNTVRCLYQLVLLLILISQVVSFGCGPAPEATYTENRPTISSPVFDPTRKYNQSLAVVIGINEYDDPRLRSLTGAEEDARQMASELEAQGFRVKSFIGREATRHQILTILGQWLADEATINDRILVYFAGHGLSHDLGGRKHGYLTARDSDSTNPAATAISMKEITNMVMGYKAQHAMFVADACYSGLALDLAFRSPDSPEDKATYEYLLSHKSKSFLMAAQAEDKALEWRGHGLFTNIFLQGLRGDADQDQDGIVTSKDLIRFVEQEVLREGKREPLRAIQRPKGVPLFPGEMLFRSRYFKSRRPESTDRQKQEMEVSNQNNGGTPSTDRRLRRPETSVPKRAVYPSWSARSDELREGILDAQNQPSPAPLRIKNAWCALAAYDGKNPYRRVARKSCGEWTVYLNEKGKLTREYANLLQYIRVTKPDKPELILALDEFLKLFPNNRSAEVKRIREVVDVVRAGQATHSISDLLDVVWIQVEPGQFTMGTAKENRMRDHDERQRQVAINYPLLVQKHEVTQGEWRDLMGTQPAEFAACGDECPVERVNLFEALAYANALSEREGLQKCYDLVDCAGKAGRDLRCQTARFVGTMCQGYRLPTDQEWEYLTRAGTTTEVYSGDLTLFGRRNSPQLDQIAWYAGNSVVQYPSGFDCTGWRRGDGSSRWCGSQPVGKKKPNSFGLYDTIGNVWEWVWSAPRGRYTSFEKSTTTDGRQAVSRGGGWFNEARDCRAANRFILHGATRHFNLGFRLVKTRVP